MVHDIDDLLGLLGGGEVGKGQAPEDTVVEVVIERVGKGEVHVGHDLDELLLLDGEGNVLDDDGGWDKLIRVHRRGDSRGLIGRVREIAVHLHHVGEGGHRGRTHLLLHPRLRDGISTRCCIGGMERIAYHGQPGPALGLCSTGPAHIRGRVCSAIAPGLIFIRIVGGEGRGRDPIKAGRGLVSLCMILCSVEARQRRIGVVKVP